METTLRKLTASDCPRISRAFAEQGWTKPTSQYEGYLREQASGLRSVIVAVAGGQFAGYLTIVWISEYPPFREKGIPEIVDFNVLLHYRRKGIGTRLIDAAEQMISLRSPIAGIGVGLTADYGAAQVLYVKRGYVPDGLGILRGNDRPKIGDTIRMDHDVALYLTKRVEGQANKSLELTP